MKTKIAIVNQRYGPEVNGGSEYLARLLAEKLALVPGYQVHVLTTCALDYTTWANHYPAGISEINGITIHRFPVETERNMRAFNKFSDKIFFKGKASPENEHKWIDMQGPYCPGCIEYIRQHKEEHDVFIFFTYLYYPTVRGLAETGKKAILVPTAHDEPPIYMDIFKDVFRSPGALAFNTIEEQELTYRLFDVKHLPCDVIGIGVDIPEGANPARFREKYKTDDYILYAGRIEDGKNCPELFNFFIRYKSLHPSDLKLVLIGKEIHPPPEHPDIISLGFVSEEDKADAMAGARMLALPSVNESLSIVVLESMALGVPVLVNRKCAVLRGHCLRSNAGLYYDGYYEFESCVNYLLSPERKDIYAAMRENAREYVKTNYRWEVIVDKYKALIEKIAASLRSSQ